MGGKETGIQSPAREEDEVRQGCHEDKPGLVLGPQLHPHQGQSQNISAGRDFPRVTEHTLHFTGWGNEAEG